MGWPGEENTYDKMSGLVATHKQAKKPAYWQ